MEFFPKEPVFVYFRVISSRPNPSSGGGITDFFRKVTIHKQKKLSKTKTLQITNYSFFDAF